MRGKSSRKNWLKQQKRMAEDPQRNEMIGGLRTARGASVYHEKMLQKAILSLVEYIVNVRIPVATEKTLETNLYFHIDAEASKKYYLDNERVREEATTKIENLGYSGFEIKCLKGKEVVFADLNSSETPWAVCVSLEERKKE